MQIAICVQMQDRLTRSDHHFKDFMKRQQSAFTDKRMQGFPRQEFHHKKQVAVELKSIVRPYHIRMFHLPHCLNFPQEIIVEQGAVLLVSTNDFDGNFAFQSRVNRFVDFTHSTWSNQPLKFILPDPARGREQGRLLGELIRLWCQPGFRISNLHDSLCTERHTCRFNVIKRHLSEPTLQHLILLHDLGQPTTAHVTRFQMCANLIRASIQHSGGHPRQISKRGARRCSHFPKSPNSCLEIRIPSVPTYRRAVTRDERQIQKSQPQ